jgi:tetratricopeptide (TPR) repeat protein
MNYFWVVVTLVALLFILFRMFRESVRSSAVQNAFLAKYTYDQLTKDQQRQVHDQALKKIGAGWPGPTENMPDFTDFNRLGLPPEMAEMLKFSFYDSTMAELGIEPSLAGEEWHYVRNPYLAFHRAEHQVQVVRYHFQNTHKVNIDFKSPEEGQNLNFAMSVERKTEWTNRTIALIKMKDWQGLLDWCWKWTKSEPKDAKAWASLNIAYSNLGRYDDAIEAYHQALLINPEDAKAWYGLRAAYRELDRYDDVFVPSVEAYLQALRINPEDAKSWYGLGDDYSGLKRYDDAIEAYLEALRIDPKNVEAWVSIGLAYSDLKRYDVAIKAYLQALRIDPKESFALYGLGLVYSDLKRYDDAIEAYRQSIRINPENANVWISLGHAYDYTGNQTAALDAVKELRRLDPARADELFNLIVSR